MPDSPATPDAPTLPAPLASHGAAPQAPGPAWRRLARCFGWCDRAQPPAVLGAARQACIDCLLDLPPHAAQVLRPLLAGAQSAAELWHLRPELYRVLALHHSQAEAERRLAAIRACFDAPAPQRPPR